MLICLDSSAVSPKVLAVFLFLNLLTWLQLLMMLGMELTKMIYLVCALVLRLEVHSPCLQFGLKFGGTVMPKGIICLCRVIPKTKPLPLNQRRGDFDYIN